MSENATSLGGAQPAPQFQITHDLTSDGFVLYNGPFKVAAVGCVTDGPKELRRDEAGTPITDAQGHVIMFPTFKKLPRSQWGIHFTAPAINVGLLEAILKAVPSGDDHAEGHTSPREAK